MAQGAIMAIEDGWVLAEHVGAQPRPATASVDWTRRARGLRGRPPRALPPRRAPRPGRGASCGTSTASRRLQRNALLRARDTYDYSYADWIYGPTALTPDEIPPMYKTVPLDSVDIATMT